jgi:dipeptidyl aminopeptidase/acylaminoacyl peptidase
VQGVQAAGKIFYLAHDGVTINTVRSDGSGIEHVITVAKRLDENVIGLAGDRSGRFLLYGLQARTEQWPRYFLVERGQATSLSAFASMPRWSPDGTRFAVQLPGPSGAAGPIYLYDTASRTGRALPVAGQPDWFPDNRRLVYVADDVFVVDLQTGAESRLTELPDDGDEAWGIQEAHVLPDGANIIFYGGQRNNTGASGNGQQWWSIPVAGGEIQAISDPAGNGISGFEISPQRDLLAYGEGAHSSACVSIQSVIVRPADIEPGLAFAVPIPQEIPVTDTGAYYIKGFSWSPDSDHIAYAIEPYHCLEGADGPRTEPPMIYLWDVRKGNRTEPLVPQKVVDGQFPVWIR